LPCGLTSFETGTFETRQPAQKMSVYWGTGSDERALKMALLTRCGSGARGALP
jgi:hypothetical protein